MLDQRVLSLGSAFEARFLWHDDVNALHGIPFGMLVTHMLCPNAAGVSASWLTWVETDEPMADRFTLLSLHPLTLGEAFACTGCGALGSIINGRWCR